MVPEQVDTVTEMVNESLKAGGQEDIKTGVVTQVQLDADKAAEEKPPGEKPVETTPVTPAKKVKPTETDVPPGSVNAGSPAQPGDTVINTNKPEGEGTTDPKGIEAQLEEAFPGKGYKSFEDVKKAGIADRDFASKSEQKIKDLERSNEETNKKLNLKLNPYANDSISELNNFTKETGIFDPVLFSKLKGADLKKMDAFEVLRIKTAKDNPDLTAKEIEIHINGKYNLNAKDFSHIEDDVDRKEAETRHKTVIENSIIDMKISANAARTELVGLQEKIKPVDLAAEIAASDQAGQEKVRKLSEIWQPHLASAVEELREFKIETAGENGESQSYGTFNVPDENLNVYKEAAMNYAINTGLANDETGKQAMNKFISDMVMIDFGPQIIGIAVGAAKVQAKDEFQQEASNASGTSLPKSPSGSPADIKPKTAEEHDDEVAQQAIDILERGDYGPKKN